MPEVPTLPAWCRIDPDLTVTKVQVRDAPGAAERLAALLDLVPPAPNRISSAGHRMLAAIAPGEWLLTEPKGDGVTDRIAAALHADTALVVDLSHGVVALRLEGSSATACLAAYTALDLRTAAMPTGSAARTRFGDIGVFIARTGDAPHYLLIADQSYAPYLVDLIARSDRNPL